MFRAFVTEPEHDRYVRLDYDTLCTQPLRDSYAEVWDLPLACHRLLDPARDEWGWWEDLRYLRDRRGARGMAPMIGTFARHDALLAILGHAPVEPVFCELRMGTAVQRSGVPVAGLPDQLTRTLRWNAYRGSTAAPGLYHAIKR